MKKRGKSIIIVVVFLLLANAPVLGNPVIEPINFTKDSGLTVPATYTLRFSLWNVNTGGTETANRVWWEVKILTLSNAILHIYLGSVTNPAYRSGVLGDLDFSEQYWVQVEKLENDGTTFTPVGTRTRFNIVPYAMWSAQGGGVVHLFARLVDVGSGCFASPWKALPQPAG